jgi:hypothetical protein
MWKLECFRPLHRKSTPDSILCSSPMIHPTRLSLYILFSNSNISVQGSVVLLAHYTADHRRRYTTKNDPRFRCDLLHPTAATVCRQKITAEGKLSGEQSDTLSGDYGVEWSKHLEEGSRFELNALTFRD